MDWNLELKAKLTLMSFGKWFKVFSQTDHTCYTVYTAGSGGFLNILPVYMDHILYPLLRDEDFMTEVHHISGQGEDSGVVYSEMQVRS